METKQIKEITFDELKEISEETGIALSDVIVVTGRLYRWQLVLKD